MTLRHSFDFSTKDDPRDVRCSLHPTDPDDRLHPQSGSEPGSRNSGGATTSALTPARIFRKDWGDLSWVGLRTIPGDIHISGSGANERCDGYLPSEVTDAAENSVRSYGLKLWVRPGIDYHPPADGNFSTIGWGFHRDGAGYPGGNLWPTYCGSPSNSGNTGELWGATGQNVDAGKSPWQKGALVLEMYGGPWPKQSDATTPHYINMEQWQLLPPGWETGDDDVIEFGILVCWKPNRGELGEKYLKNYNGGTPKDLSKSGWVELRKRHGTISEHAVVWEPWVAFDPGEIVFKNGGRQLWSNGPEPHRHYRPMMFWFQDTGAADRPYLKTHNYHGADNNDSTVYVTGHQIGDTFADLVWDDPAPASTRDIASVGVTVKAGTYTIAGHKLDGTPVSWQGTNRANALAALDKFEARLA